MAQKKKSLRAKSPAGRRKPLRPRKPVVTAQRTQRTRPKQRTRPEKSTRPKKKGAAERHRQLGRPQISGEELLFMLFKEDYHARQIFEFLQVERVKDLEQYSPQQIVRLLSRPITQTVARIRRKLADKNRCLRDDAEFATEIKTNNE